jgi:DNA-binding transcriptional LysR family regulator
VALHAGGRRGARAPGPRLVTNSADAAIGHAELGGGLAMVLPYQAAALAAGRLRVVLPGFEPPALPIHLVCPTGRLLPAKVKAFAQQVADTCDWAFMAG